MENYMHMHRLYNCRRVTSLISALGRVTLKSNGNNSTNDIFIDRWTDQNRILSPPSCLSWALFASKRLSWQSWLGQLCGQNKPCIRVYKGYGWPRAWLLALSANSWLKVNHSIILISLPVPNAPLHYSDKKIRPKVSKVYFCRLLNIAGQAGKTDNETVLHRCPM